MSLATLESCRLCTLTRVSSFKRERNFVAWTAQVIQAHRHASSRRKSARHAYVDLIQIRVAGSVAEKENLGHAASDRDLGTNYAATDEPRAIDFERFAGDGGVGCG